MHFWETPYHFQVKNSIRFLNQKFATKDCCLHFFAFFLHEITSGMTHLHNLKWLAGATIASGSSFKVQEVILWITFFPENLWTPPKRCLSFPFFICRKYSGEPHFQGNLFAICVCSYITFIEGARRKRKTPKWLLTHFRDAKWTFSDIRNH